jgi:hypothetical protein
VSARRLVLTALAVLAVAAPAAQAANVVADRDAAVRMAAHPTRAAQAAAKASHMPGHVSPALQSYPR